LSIGSPGWSQFANPGYWISVSPSYWKKEISEMTTSTEIVLPPVMPGIELV
jgi:hypothetical protein